MAGILSLPDEILDTIFTYTSYDEVSRLRLVCKFFDQSAQRVLNQGFYRVSKYHGQCVRKVKERIPRRESERRKHKLAVHYDILTSVETRISLLSMAFRRYIEFKHCCFIPGKVLDEIYRILRLVSKLSVLPRASDLLQELLDISSMAMEHFEEKVASVIRARHNFSPLHITTSCSLLALDWIPLHPIVEPDPVPSKSEMEKLNADVKQNNSDMLKMEKGLSEINKTLSDYEQRFSKQDKLLEEQKKKMTERTCSINNQSKVIDDLTKRLTSTENSVSEHLKQIKAKLESKNFPKDKLPKIQSTSGVDNSKKPPSKVAAKKRTASPSATTKKMKC